jgi:hypothetical protein
LSSSANPATLNQSVTFTAAVSGGSGTPIGTVTFMDGDSTLSTVSLDSNDNATLITSTRTLGSDDFTAAHLCIEEKLNYHLRYHQLRRLTG